MFSYLCVLLFRVDMAILNLLPSVFIEALDSHTVQYGYIKVKVLLLGLKLPLILDYKHPLIDSQLLAIQIIARVYKENRFIPTIYKVSLRFRTPSEMLLQQPQLVILRNQLLIIINSRIFNNLSVDTFQVLISLLHRKPWCPVQRLAMFVIFAVLCFKSNDLLETWNSRSSITANLVSQQNQLKPYKNA